MKEEYLRYYMLVFDASIEKNPALATRDFLTDKEDDLKPNRVAAPDEIRLIYLRRVTYGKSALTDGEVELISTALERPDENTIRIARELIHDHLSLCRNSDSKIADIVEQMIDAVKGPKLKGRKIEYYKNRNSVIARAVQRLIASGFNKTGEKNSACSTVSDELSRMGYPLSADAVRKVFDTELKNQQSREEIELAGTKMREVWGEDWAEEHRSAMRQIEDLGKKLGYIHSSDAT